MQSKYQQEPIAIVGLACRLPGENTSPPKLWEFLERGGIASNNVPDSRFNVGAHYDGSKKRRTMRPMGGMFLENMDPADFDASFFEISSTEAISMDPNQRQMLEVVFESMENAGITLESLNGAPVACFVGSYASDYDTISNRDPEDRPANIAIGIGRAILSNRLSHFLNVKGPSMTIDTACSGSLVGLDVACRYLYTGEINAAIIATSNLYLNPEHVMDLGSVGNAHSPTALCHTFDISADGYVKAEAVSAVIVKRLSDAIRDGDPIRAVVRGSATNSDGRTPGIASPSAEAQAVAIRAAYANAGIDNLNETAYLECHGTGTQAGDPTEVSGAGSVFAPTRPADNPLIIGSIKSNIGHSEPSAGLSGLLKAVLAIEKGIIPGNPTFNNPNPKIDFSRYRVKASKASVIWPEASIRRASVNSFGYGGSNVHVVVEQAPTSSRAHHISSYASSTEDLLLEYEDTPRPYTLVLSANDAVSLRANIKAICGHLINPRVKVDLADLAYTLSERRTRLWHRAFITTRHTELDENAFVVGKKSTQAPRMRVGFIFTGQGAQWPRMGKDMLDFFPWTRTILQELDEVLQSLPDPPEWSLISELADVRTPEHLRQPEFSQPLVTALQLCIVAVLHTWGIQPVSVVGHSSGEIAAAYTAGLVDRASAIKAAFYRGRAAVNRKNELGSDLGMLAVGLGVDAVSPFLEKFVDQAWIACFNSPNSITISGKRSVLEVLAADIKAAGHFARLLQVDLAYHSTLMEDIGQEYEHLLKGNFQSLASPTSGDVSFFSSVTGSKLQTPTDAEYWKANMISPVRFDQALRTMLTGDDVPSMLIEIGPSGALAGPVAQTLKVMSNGGDISYNASWARGANAGKALFDVAGRLFVAGASIDMSTVNEYDRDRVRTVIDLPNYVWNHSTKYWHESPASKDWRFKKFVIHDLLGSKILGSSWRAPTWRKLLSLDDVRWLRDHQMGSDVLMPGAGFITFALEAMYQKTRALDFDDKSIITAANDLCYHFRDVRIRKALVLQDEKEADVMVSLSQSPGNPSWHEFRITSNTDDVYQEHCSGLVRIREPIQEASNHGPPASLKFPASAKPWYKAQDEIGLHFGPAFQKLLEVESTSGQRFSRSTVSLSEPESHYTPQSYYPIHPTAFDGCFQAATPAMFAGERSLLKDVLVPTLIDDLIVNKVPGTLDVGVAVATAEYSGRGRRDEIKNYFANCTVYEKATGAMLMQLRGLHYSKLGVGEGPDPHTFDCVTWKPDITFLAPRIESLVPEPAKTKLDLVIDLIAHKQPTLKVLEVNLDPSDTCSLWFGPSDFSATSRWAYSRYDFAFIDPKSLVTAQSHYESRRDTSFFLASLTKSGFGLSQDDHYDLAIIKAPEETGVKAEALMRHLRSLLSNNAYTLLVRDRGAEGTGNMEGEQTLAESPPSSSEPTSPPSSELVSPAEASTPPSSAPSVLDEKELSSAMKHEDGSIWDPMQLRSLGFMTITESSESSVGYLYGPELNNSMTERKLVIARLSSCSAALSVQSRLEASGWTVKHQTYPFTELESDTMILVLDEMISPVLATATGEQWEGLKELVNSGNPMLWVTEGAQYYVTNPDRALVHGLFRVARRENGNAKLTTLDVECRSNPATDWAIEQVLDTISGTWQGRHLQGETEYVERGGVVHVHRIVPDAAVNAFKRAERDGAETTERTLHKTHGSGDRGNNVQLRADRLGTLQSLVWCEVGIGEVPVEDDHIEVQVIAAGVNFKDVATIMNIVPEDEFKLGCECAGIVTRVGIGANMFSVGDRVCVLAQGSYANRLQVPVDRAHAIPSSMSFQDAATIPLVFLTSIYALFHMANLRQGQSVLIHSGAGGIGIACIQLAQFRKAEIYVTVGTEDKRNFLAKTYGLSQDRIFSSRSTVFADEIKHATRGSGIDVIINSLTGELLDASWRICADGGTLIEIGKKDIVDRNVLSMEPFGRNCSFRALDLSYAKDIGDDLIARLLDEIFELVTDGHIKPIHPITMFGFDEVAAALNHIRSGLHIGKVVVSNGEGIPDLQVAIRPATRQLQLKPHVSYLIVGGLKGLCGSLAIHMARSGARRIISCSRSGISDDASARVILNCRAYGCEIVNAKGDVGDVEFVRRMFEEASPSIAGVIQGAMDKPYEMMSLDNYHIAIHAKVQGTWNLHNASLAQERPLDFFTMLSSISGVVGNKGQANYAAANTFLDAFATYRQHVLGLRANSVDLGMIEDVGYVAEQDSSLESRFDKKQWTPINEGILRRILSYSVHQQDPTPLNKSSSAQLITGIAFPLQGELDLVHEPRFGYLFSGGGNNKIGDDGEGVSAKDQAMRAFALLRKSGADAAALARACVEVLALQFARVLRLDHEMETDKPLMAYGLDSLAAVELRNWVRMELCAELSTLDILNATSLAILCDKLISRIL
ncbi:Nn.00g118160.m01.CDS01 [Neocucurbitaria sp. VM-36]